MINSCFVVPVHPPKFSFLVDLLKTHNINKISEEVIVVFSSEQDKLQFKQENPGLIYDCCVYNNVIACVITEKKFFGLKYAFNKGYKYAACIDAECDFIKSLNISKAFEHWFERKKIFATLTNTSDLHNIAASTSKFFPNQEDKYLKISRNNKAYFWFNDIPIYEKDSFYECLKYIDYDNKKKIFRKCDWDFLIYGYFLLLHKGFELDILSVNEKEIYTSYGFMESQSEINSDIFKKILHDITNPMWVKNYEQSMPDSIFMRFHRDRIGKI